MTSLPPGDIDSALDAAESTGVQSALAKLFLAEYRRHPERGMDAAVSRVLSRAKPKATRARATPKQPERSSADYTPEQERCLDGLARIIVDVLRRQLDEQRPDLARRTGRV